jgi:CHAT domain-containing protein/tetratricopeptide (TPR) repeat protein
LQRSRTVDSLRQDAFAALCLGATDRAVGDLSAASEIEPSNAAVWSDLAAAHLQRAAALSDPYEFFLALGAANRAVNRDSGLLAACFNRALALEHLALHRQAAAEWQIVVRGEVDPRWRQEAREHVEALAGRVSGNDWDSRRQAVEKAIEKGDTKAIASLVISTPQEFREYAEEHLLPSWALAEKKHDKEVAQKELAVARAIGRALAAANGEHLVADTVSLIDRLNEASPERLKPLVRGLIAYTDGRSLMAGGDFSHALVRLKDANSALESQKIPFSRWAFFNIALCEYQLSRYDRARALFQKLADDPDRNRYRAPHGRALWLIGLMAIIEGSPTASMTAYESAFSDFQSLDERPFLARLNALMASDLANLGQPMQAWRRLYPALVEPATFGRPADRFSISDIAYSFAWEQGETEIALSFLDEMLQSAQATSTPYAIVDALRSQASILAALGHKDQATNLLKLARQTLNRIPEESTRQVLEGNILWVEATLAATPEQTIDVLDQDIRILRTTSYHHLLGLALHMRAQAEITLGKSEKAEHDLVESIAESEQQRERIDQPDERISYFDRTGQIFDTMISFKLDQRRRPEDALRFSEQAKARVLWDWILAQPGKPGPQRPASAAGALDLDEVRRKLPTGTAAIEYAVLPERTVIWVLRGSGLGHEIVVTRQAALNDLVQRLYSAIREDRTTEAHKLSEALYDLLIRPVAGQLRSGERLVFVPDGALHTLSFALLRDRQTQKYLIQDHILSVAPSLRVFAASAQRDEDLASDTEPRALIIAAPDFDRQLYPTLDTLSAGDTEASFTKLFPGSLTLQAQEATRQAFLRSAGEFEIIHFGGHSMVNPDLPLLSQMLFAKGSDDPARGVLYSGEILHQRFRRTRLAVLASCATASGRVSRTEGVESLARPFLATGVPNVVASLWKVEDQATADFFTGFYRHLKDRFDVAAALRATQLDAIEHGSAEARSLRAWGAFEAIGGGQELIQGKGSQ